MFLTLEANEVSGEKVYLENCAFCHTTDMSGGMGKDFNIVSYQRKVKDIKEYIKNPAKLYKKFGYSANAMPTLPISDDEIDAVSKYIDSLQKFKEWMRNNK